MNLDKKIRLATVTDAEALMEIYAPFVRDTVVSFEYNVPTVSEFSDRIVNTLEKLPWLICEINGDTTGYAYAGEHRKRAAYQWSVDFSVYVKPQYHRSGIATALYTCLYELLKLQGYYNAYAGVALPNIKSEGFHEAFGFSPIGIYHHVGYKLGGWHDVKWFELAITEPSIVPVNPKTISEIKDTHEFDAIIEKGLQKLML